LHTFFYHASKSTANRLIIYSPDTDTFFIGLPLIKKLTGKSIFVQLKIFSFDNFIWRWQFCY
jgi:hypothetical protein